MIDGRILIVLGALILLSATAEIIVVILAPIAIVIEFIVREIKKGKENGKRRNKKTNNGNSSKLSELQTCRLWRND